MSKGRGLWKGARRVLLPAVLLLGVLIPVLVYYVALPGKAYPWKKGGRESGSRWEAGPATAGGSRPQGFQEPGPVPSGVVQGSEPARPEPSSPDVPPGGRVAPVVPGDPAAAAGPAVALWVTQDFGRVAMADREVFPSSGENVLSLMKRYLEVETAYGGGFVNAINGLRSAYSPSSGGKRQKRDWFFWLNGILADAGATEFLPEAGDVVWWDYHDWGKGSFVPAVVGAFPQPFTRGFNGTNPGTVIMFTPGQENAARALATSLEGYRVLARVEPYDDARAGSRDRITVVVGLWGDLESEKFMAGLNARGRGAGFFARLAPASFTALNAAGEAAESYGPGTGAILATGAGLGDRTPLWLVTGVDQEGLDLAVEVLTRRPEALRQRAGILVTGGQVLGLPVN